MQSIKNIILAGSDNQPMGLDIFYVKDHTKKPVVIYVHGFNGFKDWGNFDMIAMRFADAGYVLVKFNFSHNGTTPDQPEDFADLVAFGNNNYTRQLYDLNQVINWVCDPTNLYQAEIDCHQVCLIGHSMGGGISVLQAAEDKRINRLITWAGISECKTPWGGWPAERIQEWKDTGVQYYHNSRTKQKMPMFYQLFEDYIQNKERLNIQKAIQSLDIPILICHGSIDGSVPVEKAYKLHHWQPAAKIFIVESDHVFGRKHPWTETYLPPAMEAVVEESLNFLK